MVSPFGEYTRSFVLVAENSWKEGLEGNGVGAKEGHVVSLADGSNGHGAHFKAQAGGVGHHQLLVVDQLQLVITSQNRSHRSHQWGPWQGIQKLVAAKKSVGALVVVDSQCGSTQAAFLLEIWLPLW